VQDFLEPIERPIEIRARDDERRREPHDGVVRLFREHAFFQEPLAGLARVGDAGVDLGAGPQAASAHLFERGTVDRAQALQHMSAKRTALLHQPLVADHVERLEADRRRERVAAERGAVRARREDVHHLAARDEGGHRQHSAAQRLAQDDAVRTDAFVLIGEPGAGAAEPGLHLVEDEEHAVRIADPAQAGDEARGRHDDARLPLDRLDQHGSGLARDRALDRGEIAERHGTESRRERSEAVAVIGLGRKRGDGRRAAVEIAVGDDDFRAIARDALDPIAPAARRLDRGLDRLRAGVHRQRGV
jgi:hypothetical protein